MFKGGERAEADLNFSIVGHWPGDGMMMEGNRGFVSFLPTRRFTEEDSLIGTSSDSLSVMS
jgi:hypothetical protein